MQGAFGKAKIGDDEDITTVWLGVANNSERGAKQPTTIHRSIASNDFLSLFMFHLFS